MAPWSPQGGLRGVPLRGMHFVLKAIDEADGTLVESFTLRVQDFTKTNEAAKAPTIYRKQIVFNPERFEALIHTPPERARRNESLLRVAQTIAKNRGVNHG